LIRAQLQATVPDHGQGSGRPRFVDQGPRQMARHVANLDPRLAQRGARRRRDVERRWLIYGFTP
jgi:hypothetical protein